MAQVQVPYRLPHGLRRRGTHCRIKSAEQCVVPETSYQPGPKAIPEEIKFDIRVLASAVPVFAVDDFGFRRMHLQTASRQARLKFRLEGFRFLLATAVHQSIVCIPTPWEIRVCPRHPEVERVVKKQIRQNWADHAALRRTAASLHRGSILLHH